MRRTVRLAALIGALPALLACSDSNPTAPAPQPAFLPTNETPEGTVLRFIALYQTEDATQYSKLFTGDFTFEFSNAADPSLVQKYATGWFKDDEIASAKNLFEGGVNSEGDPLLAATNVELTLTPTAPSEDNEPTRDPELYKVLLAAVNLRVDLVSDDTYTAGEAPPQNNRFLLVRGDAAVGLDMDQPADSLHWYIYLWKDESPPLKPSYGTAQSNPTTWGRLKAYYR